MNKENPLEKSPIELLMLNRILYKVTRIEVPSDLKTFQENQKIKFEEVNECLGQKLKG
jgi:hypothetical protein